MGYNYDEKLNIPVFFNKSHRDHLGFSAMNSCSSMNPLGTGAFKYIHHAVCQSLCFYHKVTNPQSP